MVRNGAKASVVDGDSNWNPSALTAIVYMLAPSAWASGSQRPESGPQLILRLSVGPLILWTALAARTQVNDRVL